MNHPTGFLNKTNIGKMFVMEILFWRIKLF